MISQSPGGGIGRSDGWRTALLLLDDFVKVADFLKWQLLIWCSCVIMWAGSDVLETRVSINGSVPWRATLEVDTVSLAVPVQFLAPLWHKRKALISDDGYSNVDVVPWEFNTLPHCRHNPTRFSGICSIVWIPFLNDWQSWPGEPATETRHLAGTWQRRAGEASGFYTVNRWCRREGVPAGSWCQLCRMMKAASPSFFSFLSHSLELLHCLCKIVDMCESHNNYNWTFNFPAFILLRALFIFWKKKKTNMPNSVQI